MLVSRVVDVHVEVAKDDHLTAKRGDDFQQFCQLVNEPIGHGFTARTIDDDVDDIQRSRPKRTAEYLERRWFHVELESSGSKPVTVDERDAAASRLYLAACGIDDRVARRCTALQ